MNDINVVIEKRQVFVNRYCNKKGWSLDITKMSIEQILEIRNQPEWINAGK